MSFNDLDKAMGVALFAALGEAVTYRRCNGETITTNAEIDLNVEVFGETNSGVSEYRTEISLLRADVGVPRRGDVVITADGTNYTVQDILQDLSDKVETTVSAK